ncbi:MAG: SynChlorMet cassette radical SAM/SPASM protein ScmE, partial [Candidatus Electrothrix sp. AUS4]|nr:SynChlorMet cassette radical SAM/SPASM protein ScmE [Candidatus Electrothrix sp. AUS4]
MTIMRTPRTMDLSITNKCNLRCKYCAHFTSAADVDSELSIEEWLRFFGELKECNILNVNLTGGEPFVRKDLKKIIDGIVRNRMRYSITSNGTEITDKMAEFIASTKRCDGVQISLDGSTAEVHDSCRGQGNFKKTIEGISKLQRNSISVNIRATIQKYNVNDIERMAAIVLDDLNVSLFILSNVKPLGLYRRNPDELQLTTNQLSDAITTVMRLEEKYGSRISGSMSSKIWVQMVENLRKNKQNFSDAGKMTACGGVISKLSVRADGVIVPCLMLSHIEFGRVNKDKLKDVWLNHKGLHNYRNMRNISLEKFEYCDGCKYIAYCNGGCPAIAYTMLGEV